MERTDRKVVEGDFQSLLTGCSSDHANFDSPNYTLRQHRFALGASFRYMVHNYIPYGVRPR
jgi:hypothetical protein